MSVINGKLENILGSSVEDGSVVIALCGYGAQVPRATTEDALLARVTTIDVPNTGTDGTFTVELPGNDQIEPAGTYYTFTVKDSNGDVVQVNAYVFLAADTYDITQTPPFDPALPIPPLPPLIFNQLLILTSFDAMTFDGNVGYTAFKTTLTSDVLHANFQEMIPGNLYTFIIVQDGTGGWEFDWGPTVHNGTMVSHDANAQTIQTFVADADGQLYAISGGAYFP